MDDARLRRSRSLAAALEPVVGQVFFAPECHAAYARLGFAPSPGRFGLVALPDGPAYFTSRGSLLGQVRPGVVAAAFGVFKPEAVSTGVALGWSLTDAPTIFAERRAGAVAQLERILGPADDGVARASVLLERAVEPLGVEGRALFAGLRSWWDDPTDPWTRLFHLGDMLRECRGDAHVSAWTSAGLDGVEIGLLNDLYMGMPLQELRAHPRLERRRARRGRGAPARAGLARRARPQRRRPRRARGHRARDGPADGAGARRARRRPR